MLHFAPWKVIAIVLTCLAGVIFVIPNFFDKQTVTNWPWFLPKKQLTLGLDLRGGAHLLLGMDTDELKKDWLGNVREDARRVLRDGKIAVTAVGVTGPGVQVRLAKPEETEKAMRELRKLIQPIGNALLGTGGNDLEITDNGGGVITITPTSQGFTQRISHAADSAIEVVRRRIDPQGTTEATIVRQGGNRILIQVPGLSDTKALKAVLGETARLTFHAVNLQVSADEARQTRAPAGYKIYPSAEEGRSDYVLQEQPVVAGEDLVEAQSSLNQTDARHVILFRFNQSGARKFGKFTSENIGQPFAIVLDGKVLSAPIIRSAILGGSGEISGDFSAETANKLAIQLRSGALPAKLTIVEERTVGPSLGADSVEAGKLAGMIAAIVVIALTVYAYGTFGIFAVVGLLVHGLLTIAIMCVIGSTLTLPGIAGLVLGVAMAVDANVLIYERIREELRAGKTAIAAIDAGFTRAFITIADSQLTTLACALIMFWLGSGPIRGFAVTLAIGICTSIFSSVTVVRLLISYWVKDVAAGKRNVEVPV